MTKLVTMKTYNGDWESKVEVYITDAGYRVRWPKYNLRGWIFRMLFTVIVHEQRNGKDETKEYREVGDDQA